MAGRSRNTGSRSIAASAPASSVPARRRRTSGPSKAFWTVTCWSRTKPMTSASGSRAISSLASSESVKYSRSGTALQPRTASREAEVDRLDALRRRQLGDHAADEALDVVLVVAEVVHQRLQRVVGHLQLGRRQLEPVGDVVGTDEADVVRGHGF